MTEVRFLVESDRKEPLSEREKQIANLASEGLTDKEIAKTLRVSVTTVRTYWNRMRRKLGAANRAQATVRALNGRSDGSLLVRDAFRKVIATCLLGVVVVDKSGLIVDANKFFLDLVGYESESVTNEELWWQDLVAQSARQETRTPEGTPALITLKHRGGAEVKALSAALLCDPMHGVAATYIVGLGSDQPYAELCAQSESSE